MKILRRSARRIALSVGWGALAYSSAGAAELAIEVVNVPASGTVRVSVYDAAATFLRKPIAVASKITELGRAELVFKDLPAGRYAASAFLDSNNNKKLDTNSMGIPIEPYGISRSAKGKMGPPSFDDASFELREDPMRVTITLQR